MPLSEPESPVAPTSRAANIRGHLDKSHRIVEIGPSYNPIAPKREGWNTFIVDHASKDELIEKYRGHPNVDISQIENVDFVWRGGPLSEVVPPSELGTFDGFIASHVIEHTTDLIGFLDSADALLSPEPKSVVALAIPDRRFCFDFFQPLTTTGNVLEAHAERRSRHTAQTLFDYFSRAVSNDEAICWGQQPIGKLRFVHDLTEAYANFENARNEREDAPYVDAHNWRFTPASFELVMLELAALGVTDWKVDQVTPAVGCEFYAWLRRGGRGTSAAVNTNELNERRMSLLQQVLADERDQINCLFPISSAGGGSETLTAAPHPAPPTTPSSTSNTATPGLALNENFVDWVPRAENALRVFEGEWSSILPGWKTGGFAQLFDDARIHWFEECVGSFAGKRVLELGPLEGGHTLMLTQRGAEVLAIEANVRAYLRCLVVQQLMGMTRAKFMVGDFRKYLELTPQTFDFILASGVLYHMIDPVALLQSLTTAGNSIGLWTHYFDQDVISARDDLRQKFDFEPRTTRAGKRHIQLFEQNYKNALDWKGFCGGTAQQSVWMRREDIINVIEDAGFTCSVNFDEPHHPNGPSFCVFARRNVVRR